jgi:hypothetical protein
MMLSKGVNNKALFKSTAIAALSLNGCISLDLDIPDLLPTLGSSFVVKGEAGVLDGDEACLAWFGDNGVTYHLFQDPDIPNKDFDEIIRPGTRSRLQLVPRDDLILTCAVGSIVDVSEILEIEN